MKTALIIGSTGQDGTILRSQLRDTGWSVVGASRTLEARDGYALSVERRGEVEACIKAVQPDAVYYLAAFHHSSEDAIDVDLPAVLRRSFDVHVDGFAHVLESLARWKSSARVFYAASSHVFGDPKSHPQNEDTPFSPRTAYGVSKAAGVEVARLYRARGMHVSAGFLYNHESPLRSDKFVSQRIAKGALTAARAKARGEMWRLELGNLGAVVDWGWAPDYTIAMQKIVGHEVPGDYVVATGEPHTIRQFCEIAFSAVGLDYAEHVTEQQTRITRHIPPLVGDSTRLRTTTGWTRSVSFNEMVKLLVSARE